MLRLAVLTAASLLALAACGGSTAPAAPPPAPTPPVAAPPPPPPMDPAAEAASVFKNRCATCHGETGKGDTQVGAALNPKPRDYTDAAWQKSVTDEELAKIIVEGGAAVGKSPMMPPNPDLKGKPEVVEEIVEMIRGFGAEGGEAEEGSEG
jgi:mono/diheme cytochrome c family protein